MDAQIIQEAVLPRPPGYSTHRHTRKSLWCVGIPNRARLEWGDGTLAKFHKSRAFLLLAVMDTQGQWRTTHHTDSLSSEAQERILDLLVKYGAHETPNVKKEI